MKAWRKNYPQKMCILIVNSFWTLEYEHHTLHRWHCNFQFMLKAESALQISQLFLSLNSFCRFGFSSHWHCNLVFCIGFPHFQCDVKQLAHSYGCFKQYEMLTDIWKVFKEPQVGLSGPCKGNRAWNWTYYSFIDVSVDLFICILMLIAYNSFRVVEWKSHGSWQL